MAKEPTTKQQVKSILDNHLPTLEKKIAILDTKVKILLFINGGVAVAVIVELICGRV